jgi:hypothetical protein
MIQLVKFLNFLQQLINRQSLILATHHGTARSHQFLHESLPLAHHLKLSSSKQLNH